MHRVCIRILYKNCVITYPGLLSLEQNYYTLCENTYEREEQIIFIDEITSSFGDRANTKLHLRAKSAQNQT